MPQVYLRQIIGGGGVIIPDCVLEEVGKDELQITEHPVEEGSTISDHAFKKPREVTLRWSWTNAGKSDTYVREVYDRLLALQATRGPFTIYTGKSSYANMLFASISQTTNIAAEFSLSVVALCKEVIIVSTQNVSIPPQSAQAKPATTSPVVSTGSNHIAAKGTGFGSSVTSGTNFPVQDGVS